MRKNLLFILLLFFGGCATAQVYNDIIITYTDGCRFCKITEIEKNLIYYIHKGRDGFLKLSEIKSWNIANGNQIGVWGADTTGNIRHYYIKNISLDSLKQSLITWENEYFSNEEQLNNYYAGYKDRIITTTDTIQANIIHIDENNIHFNMRYHGRVQFLVLPVSGIKKYELFHSSNPQIISNDKFIRVGNEYINDKSSLYTVSVQKEKKSKNRILLGDVEYFKHTIKFSPLSLINEYTLKYEYGINYFYAVNIEAGYIHRIDGLSSKGLGWGEIAPFAFHGWVVRSGVRRVIPSPYKKYIKSIYLNLFYRNEEHDKTGFSDGRGSFLYLSRKRKVYGLNILFSTETFVKNFLFQVYGGISIRFIYDNRLNYGYQYSDIPSYTSYDPPLSQTKQLFFPAIQGGINIGFGFNGKKKTKE